MPVISPLAPLCHFFFHFQIFHAGFHYAPRLGCQILLDCQVAATGYALSCLVTLTPLCLLLAVAQHYGAITALTLTLR